MIMTKTCCMCKKELPIDQFKTNHQRKDGLQSQCIDCQKAYRRSHYLANRQKYIDKAKKLKRKNADDWKRYKAGLSCFKCGETHPACIQFHHRDPSSKVAPVSFMIGRNAPFEQVEAGIAKCDVLCANCHAKEHWRD